MKALAFALAFACASAFANEAEQQTTQGTGTTQSPAEVRTTVEKLPRNLGGTWSHQGSSRLYTGDWSARVDSETSDGTLAGVLSFTGVSCYARNAVMSGKRTFAVVDGKTVEKVVLTAPIGVCGMGEFTFTRVSPTRFEGNYSIEQAAAGEKKVFLITAQR